MTREAQKNKNLKVQKQPKAAKAVKQKKQGKKSSMLFGIRTKIFACFVVPILFLIFVGFFSYEKAADGMNSTFRESSQQTIRMASDYIDVSNSFISAEALKYAFDSDLGKYLMGLYEVDPVERKAVISSISSDMRASQVANEFISNIFIVTKEDLQMFSTVGTNDKKGIYTAYDEEMMALSADGKKAPEWIDTHTVLDETFGLKKEDYILSYQTSPQTGKGYVVIDISSSAIRNFLSGLDMGEGSIMGFVTEGGREIICENLPEGQESVLEEGQSVFFGQDFYQNLEEAEGLKEVKFQGGDYLFLYSKSEETGAAVCALVPMKVVTGQAESIRQITYAVVIVAVIVAALIGLIITTGIQKNMQRISGKLEEVAEGNLTTHVKVKGRDEFNNLAVVANNMISNNKKLVQKVSGATENLEASAQEVRQASNVMQDYSANITQAIDEINEGIVRQTEHAQECVRKTDTLSEEIREVSRIVEKVEKLVSEAEVMIEQGTQMVRELGDRASETTEITIKVEDSIEELRRESEIINEFVETITDISEQTNLLSLNASIEAARAGEAGKGFAVVAEEIRKLADHSAEAAREIQNNVTHITDQTVVSVENAKEAREMVTSQTAAVEEIVSVFEDMNQCMQTLFEGLKEIVTSTEQADREREDAVLAVKNISDIIEETAEGAKIVQDVAAKLRQNVDNMNSTAESLGTNMNELKTEISVFKTE
ncbi:MAG: methyl-accepting chemotaxis protein [Roseburia sp.]|nr:methyl-accepting chemotaxis protein [Roseburia sp.]